MKDFIAQALVLLQPLLLALISAGVAAALPMIRKHIQNSLAASAMEALTTTAGVVVANALQTVVEDLKDPNKPGVWDASTASTVKARVLRDLRQLAANEIAEVQKLKGLHPEDVTKLLGQLVESQVLELKSRTLTIVPESIEDGPAEKVFS